MKLKREENLKVAIEVDGSSFITAETGILFQNVEDENELFFYIKDSSINKEIKIRIWKNLISDEITQI